MQPEYEESIRIEHESDIVSVRKAVRKASSQTGFQITDITRIVTAASELTRNVYKYAGSGMMSWRRCERNGHFGIELLFEDQGPGIRDLEQAMEPGYTTSKGLGMGLPGAKRLMDEMQIDSKVDRGTCIRIVKWKK